MPPDNWLFRLNASGKENALHGVQAAVLPWTKVPGKIGPQQIVIHESLVALIQKIRLDDRLEEIGCLARKEKVQFVAGVFGIQFTPFGGLEGGPIQQPRKLREGAVAG